MTFVNRQLEADTSKQDRNLCDKVLLAIINLDEFTLTHPWRRQITFECHSICRAISWFIPELKVIDGRYLGLKTTENGQRFEIYSCTHSWLKTPDGSILDPYPPGSIGIAPILVVCKGAYSYFGGNMYVPDPNVARETVSRPEMHRKSLALLQLLQASTNRKEKPNN